MNNPASKMMVATMICLGLAAACASTPPTDSSMGESTEQTTEAFTTHYGYCAIDSSGNMTGTCLFPGSCAQTGNKCPAKSSTSCPVGQHVTDPYTISCGTCPFSTATVSQNSRCVIVF